LVLQTECKTASEAIDHVSKGNAWSAIVIEEQFTISLFERMCSVAPDECKKIVPINSSDVPPLTPAVIDGSTVHLYSDLSGEIYII
jgi:hypothetical protein